MCPIYCFACHDTGTTRTWGGDVACICIGPCETCGRTETTARHRHSCRPWPALREVGDA